MEDLLAKAVANGFKQSDVVTASKLYHQQANIYHLTSEQLGDLDRRLSAKIEKMKGANVEASSLEEPVSALRTGRNGMRRAVNQ